MAITNAQQYKQLLAKGGRTGFFLGGGGGASYSIGGGGNPNRSSTTSSTNREKGIMSRGGGEGGSTKSIENFKETGPDRTAVDPGSKYRENVDIITEFSRTRPEVNLIGTPKILKKPIQKFSNFTTAKNRKFFEDVIKAGKIPGLNYESLDEDFDIEQAYQNYMSDRLAGNIDAYGNPLGGNYYNSSGELVVTDTRDDGAGQKILPEDTMGDTEEDEVNPRDYTGLAPRFAGSIFDFTGLADGGRAGYMDGGMMEDTPEGGIMDLESGRQMYFLGKLVKKATRAVKKIAKSPFGKAALGAALFKFGGGFGGGKGLSSFFGKGSFNPFLRKVAGDTAFSGLGNIASKFGMVDSKGAMTLGGKLGLGIGVPMALDALGVGKEEEDGFDLDEYYKTQGIDINAIRNNPNRILARRFMAEGGDAEPVAKKTMPLLDMDGKEMDLRAEGGFVPLGRMERADDVPARLSKNEFVFTADAVRNAGEGDIDKGAEVMYNMMKNLESGGEVSEESQGLDGAREMFKTSQRLEEVL